MILQYRSANELWGTVLASTIVALGGRYAVISPGSRSTPLVLGLTSESRIRCIPVLDERSAGFLALGLAKATGTPVVVVTTSGTAAANLLPAVVEAKESRVPLLVLTADRPPELRECQSGQTIDQVKLFGDYPLGYQETLLPAESDLAVSCFRQVLGHAWNIVQGGVSGSGGPFHLNIPLADPLVPSKDAEMRQMEWSLPPQCPSRRTSGTVLLPRKIEGCERGLIVAGVADWTEERVQALGTLSERTGWPIIADSLSGLRERTGLNQMICGYDLILRNEAFAAQMKPDVVIQAGTLPTSKVFRQRLQEWQPELWICDPAGRNLNPLHLPAQELRAGIEALQLEGASGRGRNLSRYCQQWMRCEVWGQEQLQILLNRHPAFEGRWVSELRQMKFGKEVPVLIGNSMPVRDWEYFQGRGGQDLRTFCNRGANGIDGQLSTAVGLAEGRGRAILVTGDLSLLHDTNGFLHHARMQGELLVLLIDNQGGGIFRHLPIHGWNPPFDDFFLTPQQVDWTMLGKAYGIKMVELPQQKSWKPFLEFTGEAGIRILRWNTDSRKDAALRMAEFRTLSLSLPDSLYL